jgi:hypothetical protein
MQLHYSFSLIQVWCRDFNLGWNDLRRPEPHHHLRKSPRQVDQFKDFTFIVGLSSHTMGQTHAKVEIEHQASRKNLFKPKSHLSRVEIVCLQYIFQDLKSTFKDHFECIELKKFLVIDSCIILKKILL